MSVVAMGASSHNIPLEAREAASNEFEVCGISGLTIVILMWLPWKKMFSISQ
ncbi:MAG: hypothetical protein ACO3EE_03025 [Flavobacteriales bacterium]